MGGKDEASADFAIWCMFALKAKQAQKQQQKKPWTKNLQNAYVLASHLSLISSNQQFGSPPRLCLRAIAQHIAYVEIEWNRLKCNHLTLFSLVDFF